MGVWVLHNRIPLEASPDERDVLVQAAAVAAALRSLGHAVTVTDVGLDLADLAARLRADRPAAVFNLVESLEGHGRLIHVVPAVLDALGVPVVGCPTEAMFLTSHKLLTKGLLRRAGLPTPDWLLPEGAVAGIARGGGSGSCDRWIVKSVWEDASLGMDDAAVVDTAEAARDLLARRAGTPGDPWFAEAFIEGREFNLALLDGPGGPQVLPPAEMLFEDYPEGKPRIVGYAAKWHPESFEYSHTKRTFDFGGADADLVADLTRLARECWDLCGLRGWARVDFRVDTVGNPWILEVNVNPCLAPDAGFAAALARAGLSFETAIARILAAAPPPISAAAARRRDS
ncbi:MAG TPA: D-alanine--D-alanine ligase [Candidatus Krumholzibacteria bacterium]|nr:D-alanine--D-alanine ligase [Candidatus Krumholzibacteria bacterium]HPD73152.1 D-alanine--D-alanine ligase [Candidatus Krumholzibacteria bacterium]HRY41970.1 D-alanine--D-alanine ligase [Candidatus Krumholzibacteria bacterium]